MHFCSSLDFLYCIHLFLVTLNKMWRCVHGVQCSVPVQGALCRGEVVNDDGGEGIFSVIIKPLKLRLSFPWVMETFIFC